MIPISLTIEGLYSYQTRQTIDFTDLTEAGLFGIFGAVGSGKSSILEAITFALYGETERMNSRDNRNYNMMNLRATRSYIDFEFLNYEQKRYRITRAYRRNSKNYEEVKPADIVLYAWEQEQNNWVPQESTNVAAIIGLSYQNFKRTIIIPQGQFKEFLELGATDRTKMLKEIFNLQRFDLQAKTAGLFAETKSLLDQQEGQLLGFEQITVEAIALKKEQLLEAEHIFSEKEVNYKAASDELQQLRHLKADMELLEQKEREFGQLQAQKPAQDARAAELALFERLQGAFATLLFNTGQTQTELQQRQQQSAQEQARLAQLREEGALIRQKLEILQAAMLTMPQKRIEEMELSFIGQWLRLNQEIIVIKERQEKGIAFVKAAEEKVNALKLRQEQEQTQLASLRAARPDAGLLLELEKWWTQKENLDRRLAEEAVKFDEVTTILEKQEQVLEAEGINKLSYASDFEQQAREAEEQLSALRQQEAQLNVQAQLAQYAHTLQDGLPCPLCGALEHPEIKATADVSEALLQIGSAIEQQNNLLKQIATRRSNAEQLLLLFHTSEQQKTAAALIIAQQKAAVKAHKDTFRWQRFVAEDRRAFEQQKHKLETIEKQLLATEATLADITTALNKEQDHLEKANSKLEALRLDCARNEALAGQQREHIKQLDFEAYRHYTIDAAAALLMEVKKQNDQLEADYEQCNKALNAITPVIAGQESKLSGIDTRIAELTILLETQTSQASQLLQLHQMEDIEQVKEILHKRLDTVAIRSALETFRVQYEALQIGIAELAGKLNGKTFDPEQFRLREQALERMESEFKAAAESVAQLKGAITRESAELEKKSELTAQMNKTRNRAEQLTVLKKLFDRAGFVEYVSSIYLRQLCEMANVRFHRLTRNQLSLQLNDNNDFELIDYLNDGRRRSVKTLSGGQSFQASLSLALALAESVQTNAKADKNFFFIDEGFGTQDAASVHIVFETLKHLQKENRIVGIISHVDELKDKISVSLSVVKDEEQGSRIEKNLS